MTAYSANSYSSTRLSFRAAVIEPLRPDDEFTVVTPHGTFRMTKAEFYDTFANVVASRSYREQGSYNYETTPQKAMQYLVP
jgi:hypothetical protein